MLRRHLLMMTSGALALSTVRVKAQEMPVTAEQIRSVYANDDTFERMFLSISTLQLILVLSKAESDPETMSQYMGSHDAYAAASSTARRQRDAVLSALDTDPSPVNLDGRLATAVSGIAAQLRESGVEQNSPLFESLMSNLRVFLAAEVKSKDSVEDWFCHTFPFSQFC